MNHALLIVGGTSKERFDYAFSIASSYLEKENTNQILNHPDFFLIEEVKSIGIDKIRSLQERISYKPYSSKTKVVIIKEAQNLTLDAANALLKTLEEPPDETFLALLSSSKDLLISTIVSRCEIFELAAKDEIIIEHEVFAHHIKDSIELLKKDPVERFKLAENFTNREETIYWLKMQVILYRCIFLYFLNCSSIVNSSFPKKEFDYLRPFLSASLFLDVFATIKKALILLEYNTNVRLTMEVFFLDLPTISASKTKEKQ